MKIADVTNVLRRYLPVVGNSFTSRLEITSFVTSGTTATVTTATNHNFATGRKVLIDGVIDYTQVTSLILNNNVVSGITTIDHGMNMRTNFKTKTMTNPSPQVEIRGADQAIFNGVFNLTSSVNRLNFTFTLEGANQIATGNIKSLKYDSYRFNDYKEITVINSNTFTFQVTAGFDGDLTGDKQTVIYEIRVSAVLNFEEAVSAYTRQPNKNYWAFVEEPTDDVSKDRRILNDTTAAYSKNSQYFLQDVFILRIFIFLPVTSDISGVEQADVFQDIKAKEIIPVVAGHYIPSQFKRLQAYLPSYLNMEKIYSGKDYIVRTVNFELLQEITSSDILDVAQYFPFRDANFDMNIFTENTTGADVEFSVNLDDDPNF